MVIRTYLIAVSAVALLAAGAGSAAAAPARTGGDADTASAAAPLVSRFDDGSFEYPRAPRNSFATYTAGQAIGPWTVGGSVDLIGQGYWQAAEGDQSVDLNGANAGSVSQTFTTVPGQTYTVTYALAGNPGAPAVKTGRALVDGQVFQDFSFNVTGKTVTSMGWIRRQFTFVAGGATTTLAFASTTPGSAAGPALDDVTVIACASSCSCSC